MEVKHKIVSRLCSWCTIYCLCFDTILQSATRLILATIEQSKNAQLF